MALRLVCCGGCSDVQEPLQATVYLRNLIGVEIKQELLLVVAAEEHNLLGSARGQDTLYGRPKKLEHAGCVEEEAAAQTFWVKVLRVASVLKNY